MKKLWGGRFQKDTNKLMEDFNSSIWFDSKLYYYDIIGSQAHAKMLGKVGIITQKEADMIIEGLSVVKADIEAGKVEFTTKHEDIHMNNEVLLTEKIGEVGKKLHTARSRNDQVAVDLRLYTRDAVEEIKRSLIELLGVVVKLSKNNIDTIMPGYTHLQRAQPITFAHHMMAYTEMIIRDIKRLESWNNIHNLMPLGSGALAGTTFPIDREYVAELLDFDGPCRNSLDGVSDRDYVIDLLYYASVGMMHLTRLCEEIILWSSQEFGFVELDDGYSTGSSMMPQKKNPDAAELIRGKSGRVYGDLMSILTTMKGLPLAYNKDMQEDKECLFDGVETWLKCINIMTPMLDTMKICSDKMLEATKGGFTNATDLADYLVKKGIAFRDAHKITGEIVYYCITKKMSLDDMKLDEYKEFSSLIEEDIYEAIDIRNCVEYRKSIGGPNRQQVLDHINYIEKTYEV